MLKKTIRKAFVPAALAAVLLTTGCTGGLTTPIKIDRAPNSASSAPAQGTATSSTEVRAAIDEAKQKIASIPVKGRAPKTGYSRDEFGPAWADVDHNGCDTRNDILKRDLTNVTFKDGTKQCVLATGTLADKYTGKTIEWKRGQDTSAAVQADHIYPLSLSWQQGAQQWTAEKRKQFANDPLNLRAADGPANGSKSDSGPGSWLPPNNGFRCEYVANFVNVTAKYELSMNQGDYDASKKILEGCN